MDSSSVRASARLTARFSSRFLRFFSSSASTSAFVLPLPSMPNVQGGERGPSRGEERSKNLTFPVSVGNFFCFSAFPNAVGSAAVRVPKTLEPSSECDLNFVAISPAKMRRIARQVGKSFATEDVSPCQGRPASRNTPVQNRATLPACSALQCCCSPPRPRRRSRRCSLAQAPRGQGPQRRSRPLPFAWLQHPNAGLLKCIAR